MNKKDEVIVPSRVHSVAEECIIHLSILKLSQLKHSLHLLYVSVINMPYDVY